MSIGARRAFVLLEVLVALLITVTAGLALIELTRQSSHNVQLLSERAAELRVADELLRRADVAMRAGVWPTDLKLRLKSLSVSVVPAQPGVWRVSAVHLETGRELLVTHLRGRVP